MKIKSRKFKFSDYFWVFFILGFSVGYPRQRGVVLLLEAKCSFWEHDANSKATRRGALQAQAKVGTSPSQGSHCGDFSPADEVLMGFPQIHGMAQAWFPDAALAAVRKVHRLIFTDSRASRGLRRLLLFIKLMVCFLWISATAGSLILLGRDC